MSQHDFNIANQGFPAFRSDLNNALTALASNSSGETPPSTTYANQFWYETDTNTLYFRNEDNDAWITLAVFDQTNDEWEVRTAVVQAVDSAGVEIKTDDGVARISVADGGTVTIGTVDINGGTIDGVTIGGASAGAVTATTITGSGDMNIDSGTLFVDASEGRVGIGTTSPAVALDLTSGTTGATANSIRLGYGRPASSPTDAIHQIQSDSASLYIKVDTEDTIASNIIFQNDGVEVARIDDGANLKFNSGYGSAATAYGCRAWVNFNGTGTVAIRESGNVSSITDLATGKYRINFATSMPDDDYAVNGMAHEPVDNLVDDAAIRLNHTATPITTSFVEVATGRVPVPTISTFAHQDKSTVTVSIVR